MLSVCWLRLSGETAMSSRKGVAARKTRTSLSGDSESLEGCLSGTT